MLTHLIAALTYALAAVGTVILPWTASSAPKDEPSAANPAAYAEVGTTTQSFPISYSDIATSTTNVPILVYHIVRPNYASDSRAVRDIAVTPETFEAQLRYLEEAHYEIIGFDALEARLTRGTPLPKNPVILTFDDGWSNQYTYAFPLLVKYKAPATFFVFTNAIGRHGFLTWDELKAMVDAGMTIGDHTRSHPYLTKIASRTELWDEIAGSKELLEEKLGTPVRQFAYPFGQHDATTTELVKQAGYASARGDFYTGLQAPEKLFVLSAVNVPTTLEKFKRDFPPH